jgi:hypothetical protein
LIDTVHVADDLANMRLAYDNDAAFAAAVKAVAAAIQIALVQREKFGTRHEFRLEEYYRAKFQSERKPKAVADLRLVFRPVPNSDEIEVVGFGHRFDPQSLYLTTSIRLTS